MARKVRVKNADNKSCLAGGVDLGNNKSLIMEERKRREREGNPFHGGVLRMHRVMKPIVLGVAALFGAGLISAAAVDTHGDAVRAAVVKAKSLAGEARGDLVSAVANANGDTRSDAGRADAMADKVARAADKAADRAAKGDRDAHGDAVSAVARDHDATAAHTKGTKKVNHGGAVSAAAHEGI